MFYFAAMARELLEIISFGITSFCQKLPSWVANDFIDLVITVRNILRKNLYIKLSATQLVYEDKRHILEQKIPAVSLPFCLLNC